VLGELLGRGGMAEVFAGQSMGSHGFQKPVAIKRLLPELANDTVFVERLIGEAKLLVGMQHGNIVSVLDLARDGDDVFLVMEFMDGPSVRQLLKARGTRGLPIGVATYIVQMAATGLEFAHGRPGGAVVHADISPSNILLTTSGEVRVADFGIARREGNGNGIVEGKWAYMAPEQARGESLTPRSDVFALGVVLYELICGQHPLGRQVTADERESAPLNVIPPRVVKPSIPPGIEAICMRALAHDPRERYSRMQQFIDALVEERFSNGWREGANDLAGVIREVTPGSGASHGGPRTVHTDRPVTIVTRSLISQSGVQRRPPSQPGVVPGIPLPQQPQDMADGSVDVPPLPESGAQTKMLFVDPMVPPGQPMAQMPSVVVQPQRDPTPIRPMAPQQAQQAQMMAMAAAMLPPPELATVHGGGTFTGSSAAIAIGDRGGMRWTFAVLGAAALIGAIAAVALQVRSHNSDDDPLPTEPVAVTAPAVPDRVEHAPTPPPPATPLEKKMMPPDPVTTAPPPPPPPVAATAPIVAEKPPAKVVDQTPDKVAVKKTDEQPSTLEARIAAKRTHVPAATPSTAKPAGGKAFVSFDERDGLYARISVGAQSVTLPNGKGLYVPAGPTTIKVSSEDVSFTCRVTLQAGESLRVHVTLENKRCAD
jgi:serine/threonine protein kinase